MMRNLVCLTLLFVAVSIATSEGSGCVDTQYESPCAGSCTFTCADAERQCVQQCIPGCKCPRRTPVLHNGKCIAKSDCDAQAAERCGTTTADVVHRRVRSRGRSVPRAACLDVSVRPASLSGISASDSA
ncbi:hypothetical protein NP493_470g01017 [Ridgeia piscesae]|uniref:TIL domain-containing protein n=1 Tax=Ridgeia piscesae TaxID=27915 RepID=A0AAD9KYN9_RIDPI|nr:hypothetical protein NP493_470g01017 [Ridgeia piscesae]